MSLFAMQVRLRAQHHMKGILMKVVKPLLGALRLRLELILVFYTTLLNYATSMEAGEVFAVMKGLVVEG